jgi:hypothetical protein
MRVADWLFPFPFLLSTPQVLHFLVETSDDEEEDEFCHLDEVADQMREKCIISASFGLSSSTPEHPHRTLKRVAGTNTWTRKWRPLARARVACVRAQAKDIYTLSGKFEYLNC